MNHRRINGNFWQEWRLLRYRCRYSCSDTTLLSFSCEENCLSFWLTVGFSSKSIALTGEQTKVEFRILGGHSAHHNSNIVLLQFGSVQSLSRVRLFVTHELQHARPPCPSPTPGIIRQQKNKIQVHVTTWINLKGMKLSKRSRPKKMTPYHRILFTHILGIGKTNLL